MTQPSAERLPLVQLPALEALPWLAHAFTTRHGGVSQPPHATLNMGLSRPDDHDAVRENRRRVAEALGFALDDLAVSAIVHGTHVAEVTAADRGRGAREVETLIPPADGLICATPGVLLMATFADCVPLLVADPEHHAVGVGHAGWRGTVDDMGGALVRAMAERFGSRPEALVAAIGPSIGPCCYEVGPEVVEAALAGFPGEDLLIARQPRPHLNLWAANAAALRRAGVREIAVSGLCTACNVGDFFSHRAEHGHTGRIAALIGIRG